MTVTMGINLGYQLNELILISFSGTGTRNIWKK